jgi:hypothetical protein
MFLFNSMKHSTSRLVDDSDEQICEKLRPAFRQIKLVDFQDRIRAMVKYIDGSSSFFLSSCCILPLLQCAIAQSTFSTIVRSPLRHRHPLRRRQAAQTQIR